MKNVNVSVQPELSLRDCKKCEDIITKAVFTWRLFSFAIILDIIMHVWVLIYK
jgi:hypothetical protein